MIGHIGISSHNLKVLERAIEENHFDVIMACYSFLEPEADQKVFPLARAKDVGILVMKPFSGGVIEEPGPALRFVFSQPDVVPIPGSESIEKARANWDVFARGHDLTPADWQYNDGLRREMDHQFCRRCDYCQPCNEKISIQHILGVKSIIKRFGPKSVELDGFRSLIEKARNGVVCEAVASRIMAQSVLMRLEAGSADGKPGSLTYGEITSFYLPLALTSLLFLSAHSIVTFFVAGSRMAVESLAVLPVIGGLMFIFRSFGLSYQEAVIALVGDRFEKFIPMRNFAVLMFFSVLCSLGLLVFTDVVRFWYHDVCELTPDLALFALPPTKLLIVLPALEVVMSFQRGLMVAGLTTKPVTIAALIEIVIIVLTLNLAIHSFDTVGAIAAALALVAGRATSILFLVYPSYVLFQRIRKR